LVVTESAMKTVQKEISLPAFPRGFHLVTRLIETEMPEIGEIDVGILHVFIQHTSASLTLNENASGRTSKRTSIAPSPNEPRITGTPPRDRTTCRPTSRPRCWEAR
jgi:hypothetical protein